MKFKMNGYSWNIEYMSAEDLKKEAKKENEEECYYFGLTSFTKQKIYLNEEVSKERQKQTLYHELMHCYLGCYINDSEINFTEEEMCNVSAKSHDIIEGIADDFFRTINTKRDVK